MYDFQVCGHINSLDRIVVVDYRTNTLVPVTREFTEKGGKTQRLTAVVDGVEKVVSDLGVLAGLWEMFRGRVNVSGSGFLKCNPCDCRGWHGDVIHPKVLQNGHIILENRSINGERRFICMPFIPSLLGGLMWYSFFQDEHGVWHFLGFNGIGLMLDFSFSKRRARSATEGWSYNYQTLRELMF